MMMSNFLKTFFLLAALTLLLVYFGGLVGGEAGMLFAFGFACLINFGAYGFSDKLVLAVYRAQPVSEFDAPEIYTLVRELTRQAGLPMPRVYMIPSASPNAFATGRDASHSVIALTQGIMDLLNREELKGVLAHELAHIEHRDTLIGTVAATLAGAISMLATMFRWSFMMGTTRREDKDNNPLSLLLMSILMPFAALLIQLAISRSREFAADAKGAKLCGNPLYLASALRHLEAASERLPLRGADPSTLHLFIVNPLKAGGFVRLFRTHPSLEERIVRLEAMTLER